MKHQRHFETEAVRTRALIADLDRIVQILNEAIASEEELAGVSDRSQAGYPLHAGRRQHAETISRIPLPRLSGGCRRGDDGEVSVGTSKRNR